MYKRIRHRKGHGIHSPFVYNLITKVIEERNPYYRYHDIELIRKKLLYKEDSFFQTGKTKLPLAEIVKKKAIRPKHGALLFRLTNYFKPDKILQIGTSLGLSTLYISSYKPGLTCVSLEPDKDYSLISKWVYENGARTSIDLQTGAYRDKLPGILNKMKKVDFVFMNIHDDSSENNYIFNECIKHTHNESVFVMEGIKNNQVTRNFWNETCTHPEVTVTIDLTSIGIIFFNKKHYKRDYKLYF